jgi:N-acetylated-alpha-linked acidic dipeptidase
MKFRHVQAVVLSSLVLSANLVFAQTPEIQSPKSALSKIETDILAGPSPQRARETLRRLTAKPHLAGTPEDYETAEYVRDEFKKAGLRTEVVDYKVWLPYPKSRQVELVSPEKFTCSLTEPTLAQDPDSGSARAVPTFAAYSPSGDVTAEVVYANYGLPADYEALKKLNVDVKGKIVITRYGNCFRGVKAKVAEEHGAVGLLIYSDPFDDGYVKGDKYPDGPYRTDNCVQRGSIGYTFLCPGDPLTPEGPSIDGAPRIAPETALVPRIPVQPLSYRDALPILENLKGPNVPTGWQGGLALAYHVGAGPAKVHIKLEMDYQQRKIWNVIGIIDGKKTPNEWILLGNHRDAWVYGAVDPSSGTTAMLETARVLGSQLKQGWKPNRSIVLCSWDGEEYGMLGSTEWVEDHIEELNEKAVCYINVDTAVSGDNFGAGASGSLWRVAKEVFRDVPDASGKRSMFDNMLSRTPNATDITFSRLGGGSDFQGFLQHAGIPSLDMGMGGAYGVYHSTYDSFTWMTKFGDPEFTRHAAMARVMSLLLYRLCETPEIRLNLSDYASDLNRSVDDLTTQLKDKPEAPDFTALIAASRDLVKSAEAFEAQPDTDQNRQLRNLVKIHFERALIDRAGLPGRPWFRHVAYAPGVYLGYGAEVFSGIRHSVTQHDAESAKKATDQATAALKRAANLLK